VRAILAVLAALVTALAVGAPPASAVTGNVREDVEHEYVGLALFFDADGAFLTRCSGSLLTDTVLLTAGHCALGAASARVYFEQDAGADYDPAAGRYPASGYPTSGGVTGRPLVGEGFSIPLRFPDTGDVGLVLLDAPVQEVYPAIDSYAALTAPGTADVHGTGPGAVVTVSGYGYTFTNPATTVSYRSRLAATTFVVNLVSHKARGYNLQIATNPGGGRGGTCFGDSGGPVLLGDTDVVLAVSSFVLGRGMTCGGTAFAYRVDSAAVHDWIRRSVGTEWAEVAVVAP
jgi:hypothetical protein